MFADNVGGTINEVAEYPSAAISSPAGVPPDAIRAARIHPVLVAAEKGAFVDVPVLLQGTARGDFQDPNRRTLPLKPALFAIVQYTTFSARSHHVWPCLVFILFCPL